MTGRDLTAARIKLVGDHRGAVKIMAQKLETPKRTYQGWEARKGVVPGVVSTAINALLLIAKIDAAVEEETAQPAPAEKTAPASIE